MATQECEVTFADTGNMTTADTSQFIIDVAEVVRERWKGHARVTSVTLTYATGKVTIAVA